MRQLPRRTPRRGFSVVETLVAITLLVLALGGLSKAAALSIRLAARARADTQVYGDTQQVVDSLMARGFGNLTTGSATVRGRAISWTVGSAAAAPQKLTIIVVRPSYLRSATSIADTIVVYLAKPTPGP